MNKDDHKAVSARDLMAVTVFYAINILLFPVTLIGYLIWAGKAALTGRGSGVSTTAQGPLSGRSFMHYLGTREDEPSSQLMMVLPSISPLGVRLTSASTEITFVAASFSKEDWFTRLWMLGSIPANRPSSFGRAW